MSQAKGRRNQPRLGVFQDTVTPGSAEQAILINQDAIITALKALCAKLDADAGVTDTNYESLISNALAQVTLK